jgi:hypothetical protein
MHLKEFEKTYGLYLEGKELSKEYKERMTKTRDLLKRLVEKTGLTDEERAGLAVSLQTVIDLELRGMGPVFIDRDSPKLLAIRDELKQHQDLRKSIYDDLVVQGKIKNNERELLNSLREEVTEPCKESNYSLPPLLKGVCDDCKHLKAILS